MITSYAIQPERDLFKDDPGDETHFVDCDEAQAELWAVYQQEIPGDDWELLEDFMTKEEAEAFVAAQTT